MIGELRKTSVFGEGEEVSGVFPKQEEKGKKAYQQGIDETHLKIEDASKIGQIASEDVFWREEESGGIITVYGKKPFLKDKNRKGDPGGEGAEYEERGIGQESDEKYLSYMFGFQVGIETESEGGKHDLDSHTIGDADIRRITKESEETLKEPDESVEFVETPIVASPHNPSVDDGRGEDDEKAKKEDIGSLFQITGSGEADQGEHDEERTEKEEKSMSEFEEKKEKRLFAEIGQGVFYRQAGDNESEKCHYERAEGEWGVFDTLDESGEKVFHIRYFSTDGRG